jgi:hypothetical protein
MHRGDKRREDIVMNDITLFAIPKPYTDPHIALIQRNALQSWIHALPGCEIILMGDEVGVAEVAQEFGVIHCKEIRVDSYGTPLMDSLFEQAQRISSRKSLCFINADIILLKSFDPVIDSLKNEKYLLIGERIDTDIVDPVDFSDDQWAAKLDALAKEKGVVHSCDAIDYFVFPTRKMYQQTLPFALGRGFNDHWLVYDAVRSGAAVVDVSEYITIVHQNHGRSHSTGMQIRSYEDFPEYYTNRDLMKRRGWGQLCDVRDARWKYSSEGLQPKIPRTRLKRAIADTWRLFPRLYDFVAGLIGKKHTVTHT